MKKIDLRDKIEDHCLKCKKLGTVGCKWCFFSKVDFGTISLGSKEMYHRAYCYLVKNKTSGFKEATRFGDRLNINLRAVV